jgi:uncharacterized protein
MGSDQTIHLITERLRQAAPDATLILFGSRARGDAHVGSDVDILVVEPTVESSFAEENRLRDAVRGLGLSIDIIVVSSALYAEWRTEPGTVLYEAARDGELLYAPA